MLARMIVAITVTLMLTACSTTTENTAKKNGSGSKTLPAAGEPVESMDEADPDDPYYATLMPEEPRISPMPTGSIFNIYQVQSLYVEQSHFHVGDIISVQLSESTKASKSGTTQLKKSTDFALEPIGVPGGNLEIANKEVSLSLNQAQNFSGDGQSSQSNDFEGEITVSVMRVMKNNNLLVRGDKWLLINNGKEFIRLTGIIRAKDITSNNTVSSTKIANARIEYSGNGQLANSQRLGWLTDKLNNPTVWPF